MKQNEFDKIELRSEKVRNIIGIIPPPFIRFGISLISLFFVLFVVAAYNIPYPEYIRVEGHVITLSQQKYISMLVPYKYLNEIAHGMDVRIEIEDHPSSSYDYIKSKIATIKKEIITIHNNNYFVVTSPIPHEIKYNVIRGMKGTAFILVSNTSFLKRLNL